MNLYIETNFILELTKGQAQSPACERILSPGYAGVELCIPGFCFVEARNALRQDNSRRSAVVNELVRELSQMENTSFALPAPRLDILMGVRASFVSASTYYLERLDGTISDIRTRARVLDVESHLIDEVGRIMAAHELEAFDAYILLTVLEDIRKTGAERSVFATQDRDFANDSVIDLLAGAGCSLVTSYWETGKRLSG